MKRLSIAIIMAFSMLAMMAQEETIRVDYSGKQPTIKDFLQAYLQSLPDINDLDECDVEWMSLFENFDTQSFTKARVSRWNRARNL